MDLDDLIQQVEGSAITDEPLDRLAAAMGVKADLDDLTDSLIGHFVDHARRAGCSWSEIGGAMGVTKQAAQQRHTSGRPRRERPFRMGRFTQRAKSAVREAGAAAVELGHDHIGTEHLLLGVLAVPQSVGAKALAALGLAREHVLAVSERGAGMERRRRHLPFTVATKQAMDRSVSEAMNLGHSYLGTEHMVLGLLRVDDGLAARAMRERGIDHDSLLAEVTTQLAAVYKREA